MLEPEKRDPRAPGDSRMYLYFDYSSVGALRWYVKVSRKGRRIGIREEYGSKAFDDAYDAAVTALGESCVNAAARPIHWCNPNAAMCRPIAPSVGRRAIMFSSATDYRRSGSRPNSAKRLR